MRFSHTYAAIKEKRVVGFGGPLCNRLRRSMGKLVAGADDERSKSIFRAELSSGIPIKSLLPRSRHGRRVSGNGSKAAIRTHRRRSGILFSGDELHVLILRSQSVNGFLDQVAKFFTDVTKLRSRHANKNDFAIDMAETRGLEPCVVRKAGDLFFQRS